MNNDTLWLHITSGRGPLECAWVTHTLSSLMLDDALEHQLTPSIIHDSPGPEKNTSLSVILEVSGPDASAWAASWIGTIKWIGRSPFRPHHKRKNWFVAVQLTQTNAPPITLDAHDLTFETYRGSGPGGQHRNKVSTAVRVTHTPTGLCAHAEEERSQTANKKRALARLARILDTLQALDAADSHRQRWDQHQALERGREVRTFKGPGFKKV